MTTIDVNSDVYGLPNLLKLDVITAGSYFDGTDFVDMSFNGDYALMLCLGDDSRNVTDNVAIPICKKEGHMRVFIINQRQREGI